MTDAQCSRGPKRVRQACTNCRRKKTRCPGEKPMCSFCLRLNQPCKYDEDPFAEPSPSSCRYDSVDASDLIARILHIESKLNEISRTTQTNVPEGAGSFPFNDLTQSLLMPSLPIGYAAGPQVPPLPFDYGAGSQVAPALPSFEFGQTICVTDLPKATLDRLIDDYFRYSHNQLYSFFHEETFRLKMADATMPDFLLESVIVSTLRFSNDPYFEDDLFFVNKRKVTADAFAQKSWKHLSSRYVDGEDDCSVSVVQAITLLAIFEFIEGRQRSAWVKIGIAAKFAQHLRLMFEPASSLPFSEQEECRRAFWSIYLLDKLMTCGRARPPVFADAGIIVQLPCSENSFRQSNWEESEELEAYMSNRVPRSPHLSPFSRMVIISAILSRCSQYAIQACRDSHNLPPWDIRSDYTSINSALIYLESHVNWQQPVRDIIKAVKSDGQRDFNSTELLVASQVLHHLCYCILNHYFLLRQRLYFSSTRLPASFLINSLQVGLYHAQELNRVLKSALEAGCMANSSFLSYCCLISATIHGVYRHSDIALVQEQASKDLKFNLFFLQRQARYWPNAATIASQLDDFCRHSQAYKELISDSPEVINIPATYANRMYSLIDYTTLSARKDVPIWRSILHSEGLWANGILEAAQIIT